MDLKQIFTAKLQDTPENEGRREVMSHLANQIQRSKSGEQSRKRFHFHYPTRLTIYPLEYKKLMNLLMLMQLREVCNQ